MKFTKDEARQELIAQLTAKGEKLNLSERSINEQLEALMPLVASEESELGEFVDKVLPIFKTADANVRNDVSVAIKEFKASNEEKPKFINEPKEAPKHEESELEKRLNLLEQELAETKRAKYRSDIKTSIRSKLREKGVKDDEWVSTLLDEVSITDDFNVEAKVDSYLNLYNKMASRIDSDVTPESVSSKAKTERLNDAIKQAAEFAKSQNLID